MNNKHLNDINDSLYILGWICLVFAAVFYLLITHAAFFQNMPCWFRLTTGLYCPGCGATRSFFLLVHGHLRQSFLYYPAMPYAVFLYLWFMLSHTLELLSKRKWHIGLKYRNFYVYIAIVLILGNWIIKNFS